MVIIDTLPTQNPVKLVIFDCDGVLIDSESISKRVKISMLKDNGVNVSDNYFDTYFLGYSYESIKARVLEDYAVALTDDFRQEYLHTLMQTFEKELKPTAELKWMLSQLKTPYCIATSSSAQRVDSAFEITGLAHYFKDRIFTASEVKNGKPAPDLFLHVAANMGVAAKNCLVIEDSQAGIQGALAANMRVIQYAGASHLKDKGLSDTDKSNNLKRIFDWKQLFDLFPSLKS